MTLQHLNLIVVISVILSVLISCAEETTDQPADDPVVTEQPPAQTLLATELAGRWSTDCLLKSDSTTTQKIYLREIISFASDRVSFAYGEFTDPGCSVIAISNPGTEHTGSWQLGEAVITEEGLTAYEFDYTISQSGAAAIQTFNILYLDITALYLGQPLTDHRRPTTLALNFPYHRQ